jgi:hypothetical protein
MINFNITKPVRLYLAEVRILYLVRVESETVE